MDYSFIKNLKRNERRVSKSFLKYRGAIDLFTEFLISYFSYFGPHWIYTSEQNLDKYVNHPTKIKGRKTILINYGNVDWNWKHYKIRGKSIGVCLENAELISSILKSYGISSPKIWFVEFIGDRSS